MLLESRPYFPGVDLAKIIAMFLVLVSHVNSYGIEVCDDRLSLVHTLIKSVSCSCVDLFVLATGYLCCQSRCKYSRLVNLWLATVFWGVCVLLFCDGVLGKAVPFSSYIKAVFPVFTDQYWFFTAYFMVFQFMPLLNKGINSLDKREFISLFIVTGVFLGVYSRLGEGDMFCLRRGFSWAWLVVVYIIGGYMRIHGVVKLKPLYCFMIALLMAFLACGHMFVATLMGVKTPGGRFIAYISPFTLGVAVLLFSGCLNLSYGQRIARFLKFVSATTFGVYLIHVQPYFWQHVWQDTLRLIKVNTAFELIVVVVVCASCYFVLFALLECIRQFGFKKLGIDGIGDRIDQVLKR